MILLGALLLLAPIAHGQTAPCGKISECTQDFMPSPIVPSSTEKAKVSASLAEASRAATAAEAARQKVEDRKTQAARNFVEQTPSWLRWRLTREKIDAAVEADPEYKRLKEHALVTGWTSAEKHNEAIRTAAAVYGLIPPTTDFTGDPRAAAVNLTAKPWLPHFSQWETVDSSTGKWRKRSKTELQVEGRENSFSNGRSRIDGAPAGALTIGNGEIRIFENAFSTPDDLALLIYHETSHWVDIAGKSGGFRLSDTPDISFRTEQHAYERQATFAASLGLDPAWAQALSERYRLQADQSIREHLQWKYVKIRHPDWIGTDRKGMLGSVPAPSDIAPGDESLLARKMSEIQETVRKERENQELLKELERRSREATPIEIRPTQPGDLPPGYVPAIPTRPGDGPAPVRGVEMNDGLAEIAAVRAVAKLACANPAAVTDGQLSAIGWSSLARAHGTERYRDDLTACEQRVYDRMLSFAGSWTPGANLGADEIRAAAAGYAGGRTGGGAVPPPQSHDPVWGRVRPILPH